MSLIRILIAEDTLVCRELLVSIFQNEPDFLVVGTARDGAEAVRLAHRLKPDIITMDVHMPHVDGLTATRQIMAETPRPIIMVSNSLNRYERELTFSAMEAGALSVVHKPTIHDSVAVHQSLVIQVRLMSEVKVVRRWKPEGSNGRQPSILPSTKPVADTKIQLVAIAASTGGPGTVAKILKELPGDFPVPILLVQHVTTGFGEGLAKWLNQQTALTVRVAGHADELHPGAVLVAPDDYHMEINHKGLVALNKQAPMQGLRPAADRLFHSLAGVYGKTAVGVILTGMGRDGAEGLLAMRQSGAHTIAQDKASCVVFGMPAVAIELGAAEQIYPADQITTALNRLVNATRQTIAKTVKGA